MNQLDLESSDDDSILKPCFQRKPPIKKREVVNVFSPSSSDEETDDEEIATLSGSQPLSLSDVSQASPGVTTQPSPLEKPSTNSVKNSDCFVVSKAPTVSTMENEVSSSNSSDRLKPLDEENSNPSPKPTISAVKAPEIVKNLELKLNGDGSPSNVTTELKEFRNEAKTLSNKTDQTSTKKKVSKKQRASTKDVSKEKTGNDLMNAEMKNEPKKKQKTKSKDQKAASSTHDEKRDSAAKKHSMPNMQQHRVVTTENSTVLSEGCAILQAVYAEVEPMKRSSPLPSKMSGKAKRSKSNKQVDTPTPIVEPVVASVPLQQSKSGKSNKENALANPANKEKVPGQVKAAKKRTKASSGKAIDPSKAKEESKKTAATVDAVEASVPLQQSKSDKSNNENAVVNPSSKEKVSGPVKPVKKRTKASSEKTLDPTKVNQEPKKTAPVANAVGASDQLQQSNSDKPNNQKVVVDRASKEKVSAQVKPSKKRTKESSEKTTDPSRAKEESKKTSNKATPLANESSTSKQKKQPPKKKSKTMSFEDQVVNRLFWSFKPFTLRTLAEDLKTPENTVEFCLLSLIDKGLVVKKDFTSSKGRVKTLYWANHDTKSKEVNIIGAQSSLEDREKTKHTVQTLQNAISNLKSELSKVSLQPSNTELTEQVRKAENELQLAQQKTDEIRRRIEENALWRGKNTKKRPYAAVSAVVSSPRSLKRRINHMRDQWKNRKAKCKVFLDLLADGLEKKPKDVLKLLEIDTDEMNEAVLPPKQVV